MSAPSGKPVFAFHKERVFALVNGKVVASCDDKDAEQFERFITAKSAGEDKWWENLKGGDDKKDGDDKDKDSKDDKDDAPKDDDSDEKKEEGGEEKEEKESFVSAPTHVVTPNGLKGQILGQTKGLWGDEVSVRFENGRIAHLRVSEATRFINEEEQGLDLVGSFKRTLHASYSHDVDSLMDRITTLQELKGAIRTAVLTDQGAVDELDQLRVIADAEISEIETVLAGIDASEEFIPTQPFEMNVVEQASVGGHTGSWLDKVASDMAEEAEGTDYEKLMDEGPLVFVAGLDDAVLGDTGATRNVAESFIQSKTAGIHSGAKGEYERIWLGKVEEARQSTLSGRRKSAKIQKQAARKEEITPPDDALFF